MYKPKTTAAADFLEVVPVVGIGTLSGGVVGSLLSRDSYARWASVGMVFVGNPLIVKNFRPKDSYLKRLIIGYIADRAAGFVWSKVTK